jgi:hypothetical protein
LDETYKRILLSTNKDFRDIIVEVLRWLYFSERVITIRELAKAAIFSTNTYPLGEKSLLDISFDTDSLFQDPLDIIEFLPGLIIISLSSDHSKSTGTIYSEREDSGNTKDTVSSIFELLTPILGDSNIILSHFSVKEYLVSGRLRPKVQAFTIDKDNIYKLLVTSCLYYKLVF